MVEHHLLLFQLLNNTIWNKCSVRATCFPNLMAHLIFTSFQHSFFRYNLLFLLSGGGKFNYQGTKRWIEDQLDTAGIIRILHIICSIASALKMWSFHLITIQSFHTLGHLRVYFSSWEVGLWSDAVGNMTGWRLHLKELLHKFQGPRDGRLITWRPHSPKTLQYYMRNS